MRKAYIANKQNNFIRALMFTEIFVKNGQNRGQKRVQNIHLKGRSQNESC